MAENIDKSKLIRQIRTDASTIYTIDAPLWGGHEFSEIEQMIHGVIETFVIPAQSSGSDDYVNVVENENTQVTTTISKLNILTGKSSDNTYKVGDVILMGATSDGKKNFDRWVSSVEGENITLDILETQVATHHHEITSSTSNAITSVNANGYVTVPTVGDSINVLTIKDEQSLVNGELDVITSVEYSTNPDSDGGHTLEISEGTLEDGVGHNHNISSHSHTANFVPQDIIKEYENVLTSISTDNYTQHRHENIDVATVASSLESVYVITDYETDTYIKSLTYDSLAETSSESLSTESVNSLNTLPMSSSDTIGGVSDVNTVSSGEHSHTVSAQTDTSVYTDINIAQSVISGITWEHSNTTVQSSVLTYFSYNPTSVVSTVDCSSSSFLSNLSVNSDGVLSFNFGNAVTNINPTYSTVVSSNVITNYGSQTSGYSNLTFSSFTQSATSSKVGITGTAETAGTHVHGFSHTHTIAEHSHNIGSHTHTYTSTYCGEGDTIGGYSRLEMTGYTPHTHESVTVAASSISDTTITYITGTTNSNVVGTLLSTPYDITIDNSGELTTDTKYYKLTGDIEFPGLRIGRTTVKKTSVTPAVSGTVSAITSISTTDSAFVYDVDSKTTTNIGGNGE